VKKDSNLSHLFEGNRPPDASRHSCKPLIPIALALRDALFEVQDLFQFDTCVLLDEEVDLLAIALTELAEDLHLKLGIWQSLENYHAEFFGTPLPLFWRQGDTPLTPFDPRRFQFFLYTIWGCFKPDEVLSPFHRDLRALAQTASDVLTKHFAGLTRRSDIAAFLDSSNKRGWEIKRKLIWLGTQSYLFRFQFGEYAMQRADGPPDVALMDDFICEKTTEWSGLGVIDLLAGTLKISDADRIALRTWYERHLAIYRVVSLQKKGRMTETMEVVNLVNEQTYHVRLEMENCPFASDQVVLGSLLPWSDEWYWSGAQHPLQPSANEARMIRQNFLEKSPQIAYRYCPDLAQKARDMVRQHHADFLKAYGSDLALFPDGFSLAAAEQKRMEQEFVAKAGKDLDALMKKHKLSRPGPSMNFEPEFLKHRNGVGVFFNPEEGIEYLTELNTLFAAFRKRAEALTEDECETVYFFMRDPAVSVALIRHLVREHGAVVMGRAFQITNFQETPDLNYLLRRFKGSHFRKRYPCISFRED
jgi:hypothetical protein